MHYSSILVAFSQKVNIFQQNIEINIIFYEKMET